MSSKDRGLYKKFNVTRTDGESRPGGKHDGCSYFVLDLTHDPFARDAALQYCESAELSGWEKLAMELRDEVARQPLIVKSEEQK